ncbi:MAG TPA: NUDIX hydrolase [Acidimicrobiales bacterium]|jgi:8-oxo-dGTP pyrophosphatase MutT (NUDIX family)
MTEPAFARPRVAAGVLFFDEAGRILMVVPSYKDYLDIPGGFVEPGETPLEAARREVREELGIEPPIGRLLIVDWSPGDKLIFIFDGGDLAPELRARIQVDGGEILDYDFHPVDEVEQLTIPPFVRRIVQAARAREDGGFRYLEDGV